MIQTSKSFKGFSNSGLQLWFITSASVYRWMQDSLKGMGIVQNCSRCSFIVPLNTDIIGIGSPVAVPKAKCLPFISSYSYRPNFQTPKSFLKIIKHAIFHVKVSSSSWNHQSLALLRYTHVYFFHMLISYILTSTIFI